MQTRRNLNALLVASAGLWLLAGCSLAPKYSRPTVIAAETYRDSTAVALPESTLANTPWWELFADPELAELIRVALDENQDLAIAVERIEEARARYGFTRSDLYPMLDLGLKGGGLRTSTGSLVHLPDEEPEEEQAIYALGLDLSWELDFFGRIRNASAAEKAEMLATIEARRAVVLTLVADVARAYFELSDFDRQLEIAENTLALGRENIDLARTRLEGGVAPETDLRQAEAEYYRVEVQAFELEKRIVQKENEISVLLGRMPAAIARGRAVAVQPTPPAIPAGIPSSLLERRPDIRQAEAELIAANARIGAAKAMLFPRIALTGTFGYASSELGDFFVSENLSWNLLGTLVQPIFNAGKNRRRVEITESQERQLLYNYERTIIRAMQEVEDALVAYHKSAQQRTAQRARVVAEEKVLELAGDRYRGGVAPYLEVLDAQRSLFAAQIDEATTIRTHVVALVQIYKALGGGWTEAEADSAAAASR